jgi:hypothetical protein
MRMLRQARPPEVEPSPLPVFQETGALLLQLPLAAMQPPHAPRVRLDGHWLRRKHEFHVTVLGRGFGPQLRAILDPGTLQMTLAALDWRVERSGHYELLSKLKPDPAGAKACYSVIEHVQLPGMTDLYSVLADHIPDLPPCPPPHVTHYVLGDGNGIGVPSLAALSTYRVRSVSAAELV